MKQKFEVEITYDKDFEKFTADDIKRYINDACLLELDKIHVKEVE